jgi:vancomycin resistance protein YoaR
MVKNKKEWSGAHEQVQEFTHAPRVIPGTAEWVRQKAAEEAKAAAAQQAQEQSESAAMPKVAYDVETFNQKPLVVPWKIAAGKWTVRRFRKSPISPLFGVLSSSHFTPIARTH